MKLTAFPDHATAPPPKPEGLPAPSIENMRLSEFAGSGLVREVRSRVLDEHVLFAADNAVLPQNNRLVVYRARELIELVGLPPEQLRAIHAVKKSLDGELLSYAEDEGDARIPARALYERAEPQEELL